MVSHIPEFVNKKMKKITKKDVDLLKEGVRVLRVVHQPNKSYRSLMVIKRGPYTRWCDTFQKNMDYLSVHGYPNKTGRYYHEYKYFLNDFFRGDEVYILEKGDIICGRCKEFHPENIKHIGIGDEKFKCLKCDYVWYEATNDNDYTEYITDEDLEIDI